MPRARRTRKRAGRDGMGSGRVAAPPPPPLLATLPALASPDPLLLPAELPAKAARAAAACCLAKVELEGGGVMGPFLDAGAAAAGCGCWLRGCLGGATGGAGVSFRTGFTMSAASITPAAGHNHGKWGRARGA